MRGSIIDAVKGIAKRQPQLSAPSDRFVADRYAGHPHAYITQIQNDKLLLFSRREIPLQVTQFPHTTANSQLSYKPPQTVIGGTATIPNAGIFRYENN
jgi:hypothetical protein